MNAHEAEVNSVAFNPFNQWVLATGSSDKVSIVIVPPPPHSLRSDCRVVGSAQVDTAPALLSAAYGRGATDLVESIQRNYPRQLFCGSTSEHLGFVANRGGTVAARQGGRAS